MAEFTKGLENLRDAIAACEQMQTALTSAGAAEAVQAQSGVQDVLNALHEVSDKFFIKTMMSVPPTKACRTEAVAMATLVEQQQWGNLSVALEKLQKATKALETKAKMDGTTIT